MGGSTYLHGSRFPHKHVYDSFNHLIIHVEHTFHLDESCSSTHDSHEAIFRSYGGSLKQGSCASTNAHNKGTNEGKGGERDTNFRVVKPAVANMTNFSVTGSNPNSSNIIHAMNLRGNAGAARGGRGTGGRPLRPLVASLALPSMSPSLSLMQTLNEGEVASVSLHMPAHSNKHTAKKLSSAHSSLFSINEQRKSSGAPAHERLDSSSKKSSIHRHLKSSILNYNIGGSKMDSERNIDERKTGASSPVFNTMSQERAQTGRESLLSTCEHDNILKMDELERQSFLSFKKELNQAEKQHLSLWIEYEKGRVARKKVLKKVLRKKAEIATLQVQAQGVLAREKKKKGVPNPKEEAKNDVDKPEENPSIRKTDIVESGVENAAVVPIVFRDPVQLMEELEKRKKSQRRRLIKSLEFPTKKKRREKKRSKKNKHRNEEGKLKE